MIMMIGKALALTALANNNTLEAIVVLIRRPTGNLLATGRLLLLVEPAWLADWLVAAKRLFGLG